MALILTPTFTAYLLLIGAIGFGLWFLRTYEVPDDRS